MPAYRVRVATLADADALVRHRVGMFSDMGVEIDAAALAAAFRRWLGEALPTGVYRAWIVEDIANVEEIENGTGPIVGGGGITVWPWPPGPRSLGDRLAFVYNVYTEPAHRRRGVARLIMDAVHVWCRANGVSSLALNTSADGRPLYESMGYQLAPNPMMYLALGP